MKFHGSAASALFFPARWRSAPHQRQKLPLAVSARRNTVVEKQNAAPVLSLSKILSLIHISYGYKKDPNDKNSLIVDEEAAEVVKSIYHWFVNEGYSKMGQAIRQ